MFNVGDIVYCPATLEEVEILATTADTEYSYICARKNHKGVYVCSADSLNRMLLWINNPASRERIKELWPLWQARKLNVSFYSEESLKTITNKDSTYEDNGGLNLL